MGAALAAVAGTLFLMYYGVVVFSDGFVPGVKAFTAAVLGGIGSLPGAVLGGLLIGFIEAHVVGLFLDRLQGRRRVLDPGDRADLPAVRHSRPARSRKGLSPWPTVSTRSETPLASPIAARPRARRFYAGADLLRPVRAVHRPEDRPEHPQRTDPRAALGPAGRSSSPSSWPWRFLCSSPSSSPMARRPCARPAASAQALRPFALSETPTASVLRSTGSTSIAISAAPSSCYSRSRHVVLACVGLQGSLKWVDNFGIQILIYVMLAWGLNIVVGLAGLLDLGYVAFYAVGAYCLRAARHEFRLVVLDPAARAPA